MGGSSLVILTPRLCACVFVGSVEAARSMLLVIPSPNSHSQYHPDLGEIVCWQGIVGPVSLQATVAYLSFFSREEDADLSSMPARHEAMPPIRVVPSAPEWGSSSEATDPSS